MENYEWITLNEYCYIIKASSIFQVQGHKNLRLPCFYTRTAAKEYLKPLMLRNGGALLKLLKKRTPTKETEQEVNVLITSI